MSKKEYNPSGDLRTTEGRRSRAAFRVLRKLLDDGLIAIGSIENMDMACQVVDDAIQIYVEAERLRPAKP